ncbi:uncharacterized protein TNCV_1262951 [Trichonephila clavipes]|nr:uncharacterized protein TNCV_1262951 [Trichonephila clavipes]
MKHLSRGKPYSLTSTMRILTYAEKANMPYMYDRANGNYELHYECITRSFLINENWITEFYSDVHIYIPEYLICGRRWIGHGEPVHWLTRYSDLSSLDYFLWGHLKNLVYATPFDSDENLVARISEATARVREIPGIFDRVRQSLHRHCHACITTSGRNFEQLLKTLYLSTTLSINHT